MRNVILTLAALFLPVTGLAISTCAPNDTTCQITQSKIQMTGNDKVTPTKVSGSAGSIANNKSSSNKTTGQQLAGVSATSNSQGKAYSYNVYPTNQSQEPYSLDQGQKNQPNIYGPNTPTPSDSQGKAYNYNMFPTNQSQESYLSNQGQKNQPNIYLPGMPTPTITH